jgi:phosphatidylglycerophosphatase C
MALVFFDLDGILTRTDTFIPYCVLALFYRPRQVLGLKPLFKACHDFYKGRIQRQKLKEASLAAFLGGAKNNEIEQWSRTFLRFVMPWIMREKMLQTLRQHQRNGDQVYLVSASPDIYLKPLAEQWKLNGAICTVLEWKDNHLTGRILGRNCQGRGKGKAYPRPFYQNGIRGIFCLW